MSHENKKSNRFFDFVKDKDVFTESIQFTFNNGETEFKTGIGGICSLIMFTIVGAYACWQAAIMFKLEQFTIFERTQHSRSDLMKEFGVE